MKEQSLIYRTGQWWKIELVFWALIFTSVLMFFGMFMMFLYESFFWLAAGSILAGIINLIFACVSVRCPVCKTHWVWLAISSNTPTGGISWLIERSTCPVCNEPENKG
jgi:hypothetical protein